MSTSFFFYDLETSGTNPKTSRIMQFAGQRTTLDLEPIGEPVNQLIKLTSDVIPAPDAILITGITPQQTIRDGITEAEFLEEFFATIAVPDTIFVGYNSVRFDDEFMRYMLYRNFYDPYEWQWKDGRSRWDLLDVVRMTRALRPDGMIWPFDTSGKPSNRLQLLTSVNKLEHTAAHDALSDVTATIALAKLLQTAQPKLFSYLRDMRDKKRIEALVSKGEPFVYSSGKYPGEYEKTTVVCMLTSHPKKKGALVYDLRHDPSPYLTASPEALVELWKWKKDATEQRLPVKTLQYNRCPAVAPLGVLDEPSRKRLKLDMAAVARHQAMLAKEPAFTQRLLKALDILDTRQQAELIASEQLVDGQLYDSFIGDRDRIQEKELHAAPPERISDFASVFHDTRLQALVPLYKARNFPSHLSDEEQAAWEKYRAATMLGGGESSRMAAYFNRLAALDAESWITPDQRYLLEELQLYGQSIMPVGL